MIGANLSKKLNEVDKSSKFFPYDRFRQNHILGPHGTAWYPPVLLVGNLHQLLNITPIDPSDFSYINEMISWPMGHHPLVKILAEGQHKKKHSAGLWDRSDPREEASGVCPWGWAPFSPKSVWVSPWIIHGWAWRLVLKQPWWRLGIPQALRKPPNAKRLIETTQLRGYFSMMLRRLRSSATLDSSASTTTAGALRGSANILIETNSCGFAYE